MENFPEEVTFRSTTWCSPFYILVAPNSLNFNVFGQNFQIYEFRKREASGRYCMVCKFQTTQPNVAMVLYFDFLIGRAHPRVCISGTFYFHTLLTKKCPLQVYQVYTLYSGPSQQSFPFQYFEVFGHNFQMKWFLLAVKLPLQEIKIPSLLSYSPIQRVRLVLGGFKVLDNSVQWLPAKNSPYRATILVQLLIFDILKFSEPNGIKWDTAE